MSLSTLNLVPIEASNLLFGDRVVIDGKLWTVKYIDGPDAIGTYNVYLLNDLAEANAIVVNGLITIVK